MIHSTFRELGRKTISFSLIAFERSTGVDLSPRKGVRPVRRQMPDGLTGDMTSNIEGLKGVRTLRHQPHYQREVFLSKPLQSELPEVDAAW